MSHAESRAVAPRLPLARSWIDRDEASRSEDGLLDRLRSDPQTRYLLVHRGRALLRPVAESPATEEAGGAAGARVLTLLTADDPLVAEVPIEDAEAYLGRCLQGSEPEPAGTPVVLRILDPVDEAPEAPAGSTWADLREAAADLPDRDAGLMVEAVALAHWHVAARFSPRTGARTTVEKAGWSRRDPEDGAELFPRTDPAVIVAVLDEDDRLLLGSNILWGDNRFSLFAGFVEAGEALEAAVVREVAEEAGVEVVDLEYAGSQPWPYPCSLMCGFRARVAPGFEAALARPDGEEIVQVRWFSRQELADSLDVITLPGRSSIARTMIEDWYGGPL